MTITNKQLLEGYKTLVDAKAFWAREASIAAMMELLSKEEELFHDLEYFERTVREMVPLDADKRTANGQ